MHRSIHGTQNPFAMIYQKAPIYSRRRSSSPSPATWITNQQPNQSKGTGSQYRTYEKENEKKYEASSFAESPKERPNSRGIASMKRRIRPSGDGSFLSKIPRREEQKYKSKPQSFEFGSRKLEEELVTSGSEPLKYTQGYVDKLKTEYNGQIECLKEKSLAEVIEMRRILGEKDRMIESLRSKVKFLEEKLKKLQIKNEKNSLSDLEEEEDESEEPLDELADELNRFQEELKRKDQQQEIFPLSDRNKLDEVSFLKSPNSMQNGKEPIGLIRILEEQIRMLEEKLKTSQETKKKEIYSLKSSFRAENEKLKMERQKDIQEMNEEIKEAYAKMNEAMSAHEEKQRQMMTLEEENKRKQKIFQEENEREKRLLQEEIERGILWPRPSLENLTERKMNEKRRKEMEAVQIELERCRKQVEKYSKENTVPKFLSPLQDSINSDLLDASGFLNFGQGNWRPPLDENSKTKQINFNMGFQGKESQNGSPNQRSRVSASGRQNSLASRGASNSSRKSKSFSRSESGEPIYNYGDIGNIRRKLNL